MDNTLFKKLSLLLALGTIIPLFAETVDCNSQDVFKDNSCNVCATGDTIQVSEAEITFPETIIPWENTSTTKNVNFYKGAQGGIEMITDIGTAADEKWHENAIKWGKDAIWSNYG